MMQICDENSARTVVCDNMTYGVLIGKFQVVNPPLKTRMGT